MAVCSACSTVNPDGARFCNQCGSKLDAAAAPAPRPPVQNYTPRHLADKILKTRAAIQGEKKRVTVLFCDIKGSTKLAEQAGPELWHSVLDRFFSILSGAVHKFEGTVNQYTGDGIMALFGAPIAHEDHGQRACLAALDMQTELRKYADELRLREGLNLTLRVGLNTGEVIVGRIGDDLRMDYTAQGLTVNLAARMEHICEPGHIYLTRDTAKLVEGYFKLRPLGAMNVEGSSVPIEVFDLEGEGEIKTRLQRGFSRGASPFVGREKELAAMNAARERARNGDGSVLAVIGNAGIGKSRLCHEFVEASARGGLTVHRATGVPYAGALPLFPVQTLVKSRLGLPDHCKTEDARRLIAGTFLLEDAGNAAIVPTLLEFLGYTGAAGTPDPTARERMFEVLARWLPRSESPQVLLVEDLHFADAASEIFLAKLARAAAGTRTLLIFNYRPDYISEWLIPALDEQIALSALTNEQICGLARLALGGHASLDGVAERICARANGNPYYAEEAVHALAEGDFLDGERGAYVLKKPIGEWRIPDTVHALIAARIDRLPDDHKSLLQSAAVIGQSFAPELLATLTQIEAEPFEDTLTVLEETGFVHQKPEARERHYQFCHPLVQEVAYHAQLESRRATAHARLAQMLEQTYPLTVAATAESGLIAHHWARAGDWAKAGAWNLHASRWFGPRDVNVTCEHFRLGIQHFDRAAASTEVIKGRIAARAGLLRMVQFISIPCEEAERVFREGRDMAMQLGDIPSLAEMHLSYANEKLHHGDAEAAVKLVTDAVQQAVAAGAGQLVHRFRLQLLLVLNTAGQPREGLELINSAAGTAWSTEPIGAENYLSRGFYGLMNATLGHLRQGEQDVLDAAAFAEKEGRTASWMYANLADIAFLSGHYEKAMAPARRAVQFAEEFGSPFFRAVAVRSLGVAHVLLGTGAEAVAPMEALRPVVAKGGLAHQFESNYLATLASVYRSAGRLAEARAAAQQAVDSGRNSRARVWEMVALNSWLTLPPGDGWESQAPAALARFLELIDSTGAEGYRPWYWRAREHWTTDAAERARCRREAIAAFERIGAVAHVERLRA